MRILVIGSGGREHALVHTFWRQGHTVYAYPGNPGIFIHAIQLHCNGADYNLLIEAVKANRIDLTVVGSEVHLEKGIQDRFALANLPLFGPSKTAAKLETSKAWAKQFMSKYKIPTASFEVCSNSEDAKRCAQSLFLSGRKAVVKASGLAAGKGVVCCHTYEEARQAILQISEEKIYGAAGAELVIEEMIAGPELSLQAFVDGKTVVPLMAAQDHKRLLEGDKGPNTGGMGAYAPVTFVTEQMQDEIREAILEPTIRGLQQEQIVYKGILYFGLMITDRGPYVIEYNCRFGDPEAEAILPLIESDSAELMMACIQGTLHEKKIRYKPLSSAVVILASQGYPTKIEQGKRIELPENRDDLLFFHAGTALDNEGNLVTAGGRVIAVTALGSDADEAIAKAYQAIETMPTSWAHYRKDIGKTAIFSAV